MLASCLKPSTLSAHLNAGYLHTNGYPLNFISAHQAEFDVTQAVLCDVRKGKKWTDVGSVQCRCVVPLQNCLFRSGLMRPRSVRLVINRSAQSRLSLLLVTHYSQRFFSSHFAPVNNFLPVPKCVNNQSKALNIDTAII